MANNIQVFGTVGDKLRVRIDGIPGETQLTPEELDIYKKTGELPFHKDGQATVLSLEERVRALESQFKGIGVVSQEDLGNVLLEGKEILEKDDFDKFAGDVLDAIEALGKRIEALEAIVTSAPAESTSKPEKTPPAEDSKANKQRGNKPQ